MLKPKGETNSSFLVLHPSSGVHTGKTVGSHLKDVCLFGDIAKDERIVAHLEKMFGLKITRGDGLPSRRCRSCYAKI